MKVICIDNYGWISLTIGKIYDVIDENDRFYKVKNRSWFNKSCFKPLSEIRNEKINKLLR